MIDVEALIRGEGIGVAEEQPTGLARRILRLRCTADTSSLPSPGSGRSPGLQSSAHDGLPATKPLLAQFPPELCRVATAVFPALFTIGILAREQR